MIIINRWYKEENVSGGKDKCICHDTVLFPVILRVELLPIVKKKIREKKIFILEVTSTLHKWLYYSSINFKCICVYPFLCKFIMWLTARNRIEHFVTMKNKFFFPQLASFFFAAHSFILHSSDCNSFITYANHTKNAVPQ